MGNIVVILIYIIIGVSVAYYIIKIAVKHAISESLEDIRGTISKSIGQNRDEHVETLKK